jgi:hypothetical protein
MSQNMITRSERLGHFLGLDVVDWCLLFGSVVLIGLLLALLA